MKIKLYKVNLNYIKYLYYNIDNKVQYNEKETDEYNQNRPYVGIVLFVKDMSYFVPLEHPRLEHKKLKNNPHIIKIKGGRYGLLALNNMLPIHNSQLIDFDINIDKNRNILITQFQFCKKNYHLILQKANIIYKKRTDHPNLFEVKVYCDFEKLEEGMIKFCEDQKIDL